MSDKQYGEPQQTIKAIRAKDDKLTEMSFCKDLHTMNQIDKLKKDCERIYGREVASPTDFEGLSLKIRNATGRNISVSTLKRIWGYVNYPHNPSNEILSILSAYAGYKDWHDFNSADVVTDSSDFIGSDIIKSTELKRGNLIRIRWKPDRICILEYLGMSKFKVVEAQNCKLIEEDIFSCGVFAKGEPMICHEVRRGGKLLADGYVAGKTDGIFLLQIMK